MQKQQFTDGSPVTPEWLNAMQNPTYEGTPEDVGHIPLPPEYNNKIDVITSSQGVADLSSVASTAAMIYHNGSPTSLEKETLIVNGISSGNVKVIFVVPVGADYELDVVVPVNSESTTTVTLKAGSIGIFKRFNYGGNSIWKYCELNRRDCAAFFASVYVDTIVKAPMIRVGDTENFIDIVYDVDPQSETFLGLKLGALNSNRIIYVPKLHVWKQAGFDNDVDIAGKLNVQGNVTIGDNDHNSVLNIKGGLVTPAAIQGKNVPASLTSIGEPTEGVYINWQLRSNWSIGQVKKIFNDTDQDIVTFVRMPKSIGIVVEYELRPVTIPSYRYKEFTCVSAANEGGYDLAILAPSA
jgi:hypothetical protein